MDQRPPQFGSRRSDGRRQKLAGLSAWPQSLSRQSVGHLSAGARLFEDLALARGDGRHPRILCNLGRADLLILDDWGLEPLDAAARHDLLEILEERYGRRSSLITSQLPIDRWHELLDHLTHRCHILETGNDSFRFKNSSAIAAKPAKEKARNLTNA